MVAKSGKSLILLFPGFFFCKPRISTLHLVTQDAGVVECLSTLLAINPDFHITRYAGEIMHGKVSRVKHDNRGCFRNVPQGILSTRYHSLSAAHTTLPEVLAITSITEDTGVIMGVRHREYTIESVQYHPESILSEGGDDLIRNFLGLRGGRWEENPEFLVQDNSLPPFPVESLPKDIASNPSTSTKIPSILEKIYAQRLQDVAKAQSTPGTTLADLETLLSLNIAPPLIPFLPRVQQTVSGHPSLLAEIKRASPSKGPISVTTSPASQALIYALAGAQTISVLTEPKWFLGSLQDMLHARMSVSQLPNRPAILRKDFILSRYQIIESRIWGADTILLIVSMLPEILLRDLYKYSLELGMEPLVEVNSAKEMELALSLPAKIIGVNNRNLHDFQVDMGTTSRLSGMAKGKDVFLCALSGISCADDVQKYAAEGIGAVLIGESLMRAADPATFIRELLSIPVPAVRAPDWHSVPPLVKICGIKSKEEALAVAEAGADMIGLMFVESSKRHVDLDTAQEISQAIRELRFIASFAAPEPLVLDESQNTPWFTTQAARLSSLPYTWPLLVGVFQNPTLTHVLYAVAHAQLDMVQLHGNEPFDWACQIPVPVIRVFHVGNGADSNLADITRGGAHQFVLLDSIRNDGSGMSGGSGKTVDWDIARRIVRKGEISLGKSHLRFPLPIILAGGLTPDNVASAILEVQPWAVDVSGGVEANNGMMKDLHKVRAFIKAAKGVADTPLEGPKVSEDVSQPRALTHA